MNQLTTITDVYDEIRAALGEHADNFNIEGIANDAYIFNPTTQTFEPSPEVTFWAAVEANTTQERAMQDATYARVTRWTENRTPSGNWSTKRTNEKTEDFKPHELSNFLNVRFPGERRCMSYFKQGYLPYRISVPSPDKQIRHVYTIEYYDGPREHE